MQKVFTTTNSNQTKALGKILAKEICGGTIICLVGELGSGKTTFTQGLLRGLKIKGPHTSPTFLIMKKYKPHPTLSLTRRGKKGEVFHIDAYRVNSQDILNLGWEEIIADKKNVVIIEWADKICDIIPKDAIWINFKWVNQNKRKIIFNSKF